MEAKHFGNIISSVYEAASREQDFGFGKADFQVCNIIELVYNFLDIYARVFIGL